MSAMVTCLSLWQRRSAPPARLMTVPSSFINSLMTPTGGRPLSLPGRPRPRYDPRQAHPPIAAISGNTWPDARNHWRRHSDWPAPAAGRALVRRNAGAAIGLVIDRHREGGGVVGFIMRDIGSSRSRRASSVVIGAQTMPEVWRMMNAIFSAVHSDAATISRPRLAVLASVTTTSSPWEKACRTSWIGSAI